MFIRRCIVPDGCSFVASRDALGEERLARAESLAYRYGEAYDSYLLLEDGLSYFFGRDGAGVVGFSHWRNHLYVVGGLAAPATRRAELLRDFMQFARTNRLEISFLNLLKSDLPLFRAHGFEISKVGEEPIIDLRSATWQGNPFAWVRRQENYCLRRHVTFEELDLESSDWESGALLRQELQEVSREHLNDTVYGRELSMMVGRLDLQCMFRKRVFVARRDRRIEAFIVCIPACDGQMWAVETFRRRPDSTRGVVAFLILQLARRLQGEGVAVLSLCQVPALRVRVGTPSDSRFVTNGLNFWYTRLPWFYDVPRLYHFKSRFRPAYRECFLASYPCSRWVPLVAFFFKWGIIRPDLTRLPIQILRRMRKWSHSESLADPHQEAYELVERLEFDREASAPEQAALNEPLEPAGV